MKKPKARLHLAKFRDCEKLNCSFGCRVVTITETDFNRLWKLAKEAIHTNKAHEVED